MLHQESSSLDLSPHEQLIHAPSMDKLENTFVVDLYSIYTNYG
jgi:hypothetical protein